MYSESSVVAVLIQETTYTRGLIGEVDVIEILRSVGIEVIHKGRRGDGGVDIICKIRDIQIWIQVKNWRNMIEVLHVRKRMSDIVVGNKFSPSAIDEANISEDLSSSQPKLNSL
ncbi:hypothetical protein C2G38_2254248 [Gigaspora rosea]|uniref:Restriction endonuclease type IV Mrr domain-containing protein n=1 Tax=Gigaspora rosea TaxID=44941 RepID=A0A397UC33_9GLOM|nr:hypothetical protein C2G38_2254248 [Gigaspora rosea]